MHKTDENQSRGRAQLKVVMRGRPAPKIGMGWWGGEGRERETVSINGAHTDGIDITLLYTESRR